MKKTKTKFNILCPICGKPAGTIGEGEGEHDLRVGDNEELTCPSCEGTFETRVTVTFGNRKHKATPKRKADVL